MASRIADASRRDLIAAVASVAAAASAAQDAQAQTPSNPRFFNPTGMSKPTGYSQVVEINGPHRTIYLAGQTGIDANGKLADGFRAQAVQVMENIKTALASVGAGFEHVVKLTSYLTDLEANGAEFREVRNSYFPNKAGLSPKHRVADIAPCKSELSGGSRCHCGGPTALRTQPLRPKKQPRGGSLISADIHRNQ
jgi:enamine deaminase RidA (YjgF/YER057c/UK114 family)